MTQIEQLKSQEAETNMLGEMYDAQNTTIVDKFIGVDVNCWRYISNQVIVESTQTKLYDLKGQIAPELLSVS